MGFEVFAIIIAAVALVAFVLLRVVLLRVIDKSRRDGELPLVDRDDNYGDPDDPYAKFR